MATPLPLDSMDTCWMWGASLDRAWGMAAGGGGGVSGRQDRGWECPGFGGHGGAWYWRVFRYGRPNNAEHTYKHTHKHSHTPRRQLGPRPTWQ